MQVARGGMWPVQDPVVFWALLPSSRPVPGGQPLTGSRGAHKQPRHQVQAAQGCRPWRPTGCCGVLASSAPRGAALLLRSPLGRAELTSPRPPSRSCSQAPCTPPSISVSAAETLASDRASGCVHSPRGTGVQTRTAPRWKLPSRPAVRAGGHTSEGDQERARGSPLPGSDQNSGPRLSVPAHGQ